MSASWKETLQAYKYPVNLADFVDAGKYPGFFECNISGDLDSTRAFQDRFREKAPYHLGAWYEVMYWKLYSQGGRANGITKRVFPKHKACGNIYE